MSLKRARQIHRRARKAGLRTSITQNKAACDLHDPSRHMMCGHYVVVESYFNPAGGFHTARYLWE